MKQTILSIKQSEILENLIIKYGQLVTTHQIYDAVENDLDVQQTKNLILKLVKNGWLVRIKRELYAISDLSSRGSLNLFPFTVANLLESESYVSFESALQQYGMYDQLTNKTISISLHQRKSVSLSGIEYVFVKTNTGFYLGWQNIQIENRTARVATPEKALIDLVHFHRSEYSLDLVIEKLTEHKGELDLNRFNEYLSKMPRTTQKIIGFLFDLVEINSEMIYERVSQSRNSNWMLPGDKKFNAKWRLYYREYFDKYNKT